MKSDHPTDDKIRKYLLGQLDDREGMALRLSEQMFSDTALSELVDSIEDEIIEEYLDGTATPRDQAAIEQYFLRPAERQEKVRFARLLRSHLELKPGPQLKKKMDVSSSEQELSNIPGSAAEPTSYWRVHFRAVCEFVALVLLVIVGLAYVSGIRREMRAQLDAVRNNQMRVESELAKEHERSASLARRIEQLQPPVAILTFLGPTFRTASDAPKVDIRPWTQRIKVEIDLQGVLSDTFSVSLQTTTQKTIWSQSGIAASSGGLRFEMPARGLSTAEYCLVVSSRPEPYCFQARVVR